MVLKILVLILLPIIIYIVDSGNIKESKEVRKYGWIFFIILIFLVSLRLR